MSSVKSITIYSESPWSDGLVKRTYEVTLTDNFAVDHVEISRPVKQLPGDDGVAIADDMLRSRKDNELGPEDKAPQWNDTQAIYDRRSLGLSMVVEDVDDFYAYLPLFKAMELRSGNNAGQRAGTLGVTTAEYNLMASRHNDVEGIAFFLDDHKSQIWDAVLPDWV